MAERQAPPTDDRLHPINLAGSESLVASDTGVALIDGDDTWRVTPTADHYYQLRSANTDTCLAMFTGEKALVLVTEMGAEPEMKDEMKACADMSDTARATSNARNTQKWQIIPADGGYTLRNALSNQDLSIILGTEKSIDFSANKAEGRNLEDQSLRPATGTLVQLPKDKTSAAWVFTREAVAFAEYDGTLLYPGKPGMVSVTVGAGENKVATFAVSGGGTVGTTPLTFTVTHADGTLSAATSVDRTCGPDFTPTPTGADSEELTGEKPGSGPYTSAFDGRSDSFWHSAWAPTDKPYPHWLTMDAGEVKTLCSLNYLPRQDSPNGRVKTYNIHVSDNGNDWGTPIATGNSPTRAPCTASPSRPPTPAT